MRSCGSALLRSRTRANAEKRGAGREGAHAREAGQSRARGLRPPGSHDAGRLAAPGASALSAAGPRKLCRTLAEVQAFVFAEETLSVAPRTVVERYDGTKDLLLRRERKHSRTTKAGDFDTNIYVCDMTASYGRLHLNAALQELGADRVLFCHTDSVRFVVFLPSLCFLAMEFSYVLCRFLYQRLDDLYLLLVTTINSNIMEDLETLKTISKLIPEYCEGNNEEAVTRNCFELIAALDETISLGYKENATLQQIKTFVCLL